MIGPKKEDENTIRLFGGGPTCPDCEGPTYAVTGDESAERPWWCPDCNLRTGADR